MARTLTVRYGSTRFVTAPSRTGSQEVDGSIPFSSTILSDVLAGADDSAASRPETPKQRRPALVQWHQVHPRGSGRAMASRARSAMARAALLAIAMSLPIISIPPAATATREWDTIASGSWIGGLV